MAGSRCPPPGGSGGGEEGKEGWMGLGGERGVFVFFLGGGKGKGNQICLS